VRDGQHAQPGLVVELAGAAQRAIAVDGEAGLGEQDVAAAQRVEALRQQDRQPRRVDVDGLVVHAERHLDDSAAEPEPLSPLVVEEGPVDPRPVVGEGAGVAREQLGPETQAVGQLDRDAEADLEQLEAAAR
jgi:hypothetical protein